MASPNQPDRIRSARDGIERDFAVERFVSQELSMERRCWRCRAALPPDDCVSPTPTQISSNFLKLVGNSAIKTTTLAKLRRSDSDAAAVAQFVDRVEQVHDIEADFDGCLLRDLNPA